MDEDDFIIETGVPCVYCGNKQAEIEFLASSPYIIIYCTNCECYLPHDADKFLQFMKKIAKQRWKEIMTNTDIKKRNCPFCGQDWDVKDKVEFGEDLNGVLNGDPVFITCKNCHGVSPCIKLTKEKISLIETQNDCEEIIKDKIINIALTKNYKKV